MRQSHWFHTELHENREHLRTLSCLTGQKIGVVTGLFTPQQVFSPTIAGSPSVYSPLASVTRHPSRLPTASTRHRPYPRCIVLYLINPSTSSWNSNTKTLSRSLANEFFNQNEVEVTRAWPRGLRLQRDIIFWYNSIVAPVIFRATLRANSRRSRVSARNVKTTEGREARCWLGVYILPPALQSKGIKRVTTL